MQSHNIGYIEKLDHLRFLAAFAVIEFHTELWLAPVGLPSAPVSLPLFHQGWHGVGLFMVISGFILGAITWNRQIEVRQFYLNRLVRIYPLYILVISLGYFAGGDRQPTAAGLDYLLALLPISNLYRLHYGAYGAVFWSTAVELQFYLLFPAILVMLQRHGGRHLLALIGFLVGLRGLVWLQTGEVHYLAYLTIFGALDLFLIGILAGTVYVADTGRRWSGWPVAAMFAIVNLAIFAADRHPAFFNVDFDHVSADGISHSRLWVIYPTLQGGLFAGLILAYLWSRWTVPFSAAVAWLGRISYSLYAWHALVILIALRYRIDVLPAPVLGALVIVPVTTALAVPSHHLIERPFLALRRRYLRDDPDRPEAPEPS